MKLATILIDLQEFHIGRRTFSFFLSLSPISIIKRLNAELHSG
jgi:hypothetical protein